MKKRMMRMNRLDRYTKAVLAVVALSALALPVKAEEKVWYCNMTGLAKTDIEGDRTYKLEKFKMKVSERNVVFGKGGVFNNMTMPIVWWGNSSFWHASDEHSSIKFENGQFHYGQSSFTLAFAVSARCDDF